MFWEANPLNWPIMDSKDPRGWMLDLLGLINLQKLKVLVEQTRELHIYAYFGYFQSFEICFHKHSLLLPPKLVGLVKWNQKKPLELSINLSLQININVLTCIVISLLLLFFVFENWMLKSPPIVTNIYGKVALSPAPYVWLL